MDHTSLSPDTLRMTAEREAESVFLKLQGGTQRPGLAFGIG